MEQSNRPSRPIGKKSYQSQLTRWADRLLPFDFNVNHLSGCKLAIVDYLSRFPTFEVALLSNFDEHYVVKCISKFFEAWDFIDRWANTSPASIKPSDIPSISGDIKSSRIQIHNSATSSIEPISTIRQ